MSRVQLLSDFFVAPAGCNGRGLIATQSLSVRNTRRALRSTAANALVVVAGLTVAACAGLVLRPPTKLAPPAINFAGVTQAVDVSGDSVMYRFADGRTYSISTSDHRPLTPAGWGGSLVIAGKDSVGAFVASYLNQGGLPPDCYVDNATGVERGVYVELRGVLWTKAVSFVAAEPIPPDYEYPSATRFCFDEKGLITRSIAP